MSAAELADRPEGFRRVAQALAERGHPHAPVWLEVSARTSQEAADALGIATGIDLDALVDAGAFISGVLGRPPVSRAGKALLAKREKAAA